MTLPYISSSSSCHTASMDLPDPLPPPVYRPSLPESLQGYILYQHRAVVYRFLLVVLPLLIHVMGSTGVYRLLLQQCPACLVHLTLIVFMMGVSGIAAVSSVVASRTCSILLTAFLFCYIFIYPHNRCLDKTAFYFIGQVWLRYDR